MASRERLTIIPRGVPYMTKLLRYFVSEDSIFLHLEHVQGGDLRGPSIPLSCGVLLSSPALSSEEEYGLVHMCGPHGGGGGVGWVSEFLEAEGGARLPWTSVWC